MATISTCIIVKNEINNIPGLVDDLRKFSDEIIIVDTGSDDGTFEWLQENQDDVLKVSTFEWIKHFAKARNYSFSKATMDWIFWCDADDRISEKLINDLQNAKKNILDHTDFNAFYINYRFATDALVPRIRLLKRSDKPYWTGACHEYVYIDDISCSYDTFDQNDSLIIHQNQGGHPARNLPIFINTILRSNNITDISARDMYYLSNELRDNGYKDKAIEAAKLYLSYHEICLFDAWNAIIYTLSDYWRSTPELSKEGVYYIEKFINKFNSMRGDVWYILGLLKLNIGLNEQFIECCHNAINTTVNGILTYNEHVKFSKIYPAFDIYLNIDDKYVRDKIVEHLQQYKDYSEVINFFKKNIIYNKSKKLH